MEPQPKEGQAPTPRGKEEECRPQPPKRKATSCLHDISSCFLGEATFGRWVTTHKVRRKEEESETSPHPLWVVFHGLRVFRAVFISLSLFFSVFLFSYSILLSLTLSYSHILSHTHSLFLLLSYSLTLLLSYSLSLSYSTLSLMATTQSPDPSTTTACPTCSALNHTLTADEQASLPPQTIWRCPSPESHTEKAGHHHPTALSQAAS